MKSSEYAVSILVESPKGIPLVRDPMKPSPIYWKLPGGKSEEKENAKEAALRELREEIGIVVKEEALQLIYQEDRENHTFMLFSIKIKSLSTLKDKGNEGEEIKIFTLPEISKMPSLFPPHRKILHSRHLI